MNKQYPLERKRKLLNQQNSDDEEEQIQRTLNFFDSILDQYLSDDDITDNKTYREVKSTSTSTSSSSSSPYPKPIHHDFQQYPTTYHIRRYTSEDNLNQNQSTEDFSKNLSSFIDKTGGISASLIDLTSFSKLSSQPRFRFVPSIEQNPEPKYEHHEQFHIRTIPSDPSSFINHQTKPSHPIVKPTVIVPSIPQPVPVTRLVETNLYSQNGNSAFKPPHSSNKIQQRPSAPNTKRNDLINKPSVNSGLINSNNNNNNKFSYHQQHPQMMAQFHQSLMDLSTVGIPDSNMMGSRTSYPSPNNYNRPLNKLNSHHQYHHHPHPPPATRITPENPISRWIQHVTNSSSISGLVEPSYHRPVTNRVGNRSYPQSYPYGSHVSSSAGVSSSINSVNHHQQQHYSNPVNITNYHPPSVPLASSNTPRNSVLPLTSSNVYRFNQNNFRPEKQSKRNSYRHDGFITTYL